MYLWFYENKWKHACFYVCWCVCVCVSAYVCISDEESHQNIIKKSLDKFPNVSVNYFPLVIWRLCFRLSEAEAALVGNTLLRPKSPDELTQEMGELAPFAFKLLGSIYSRTDRCSKASESFVRSLKLNPFLWSSFETLCKTGEGVWDEAV